MSPLAVFQQNTNVITFISYDHLEILVLVMFEVHSIIPIGILGKLLDSNCLLIVGSLATNRL